MAGRPSTARSEISSAISEDGHHSRPATGNDQPSLPNPSTSQHGYLHLRGVTQPTNRSVRNPPPPPSNASTSRPQSPTSTTSRTHVPSLTAQGFFRPMSSQKLQAQKQRRQQQQRAVEPPAAIPDGDDEGDETRSVSSSRRGPVHTMPKGHRLIPSLATDMTQSEAPETHDAASQDHDSHHEGDTGLVNGSKKEGKHRPTHLNVSSKRTSDVPQKSPLSFGSGFSLGSRRPAPGHQVLGSNATSPDFNAPRKSLPPPVQSALGKNHEYFEGNTVFCWGGRFQNAHDRPITFATGIVLVLPAILFFVFS
jgi:palmitoyltransferase ZDHHC9/14/18